MAKKFKHVAETDDSCRDQKTDELNFSKLSVSDNSDADSQAVSQKGQLQNTRKVSQMAEKLNEVVETDYSCASYGDQKTDELNFSKLSVSDNSDADSQAVAQKGQALFKRHWRHECFAFPFRRTYHKKYCELCDCFVCDAPAPCPNWNQYHCHVFGSRRKLLGQQAELLNQDAKLYVSNLPYYIGSEHLAGYFRRFGEVKASKVVYQKGTQLSKGYAFVIMSSVEEAEHAIRYNGSTLDGRRLTIEASPSRSPPGVTYTKIYVDNLPLNLDVKLLEETFRVHGDAVGYKVISTEIFFLRATGSSTGVGYVRVISGAIGIVADAIIAELSGRELNGNAIRLRL